MYAAILTLEQVAAIPEQWPWEASRCPWDELLASHEGLREKLAVAQENWRAQAEHDAERIADAQAQLLELKGQGHYEWAARLADAQTDILSLAVPLRALFEGEAQAENSPNSPISIWDMLSKAFNMQVKEALDRPGVQRLLAAAETPEKRG